MYKKVWYDQIITEVCTAFSIDEATVNQPAWRSAIKKLFDQGILISEITAAIPQAAEKKKWPSTVSFWKRIEDVVYLNRKPQPSIRIDTGLTKITFNLPTPPEKSR